MYVIDPTHSTIEGITDHRALVDQILRERREEERRQTIALAHAVYPTKNTRVALTDEERAAFYPACNNINGQAIIRALVTLGSELDERR